MILVLADSDIMTQSLQSFLSENKIDYIFHFSTISDAGAMGKGDAIVGKASYKGFRRILIKNNIRCVIDVISEKQSKTSYTAIDICNELKIPIIKFVSPTLLLKQEIVEKYNINCVVDYSYLGVAEKINNTVGNVLFLAKSYNVKTISDLVFDRNDLYTLIPSGFQFDVDLALEFGIPIMNVIAVDDINNEGVIKQIIENLDIKILVTDTSADVFKKFNLVKDSGIEIIFTQDTGIEYLNIADDYDSVISFINETIQVESESDIDEQFEDNNSDIDK